MTTKARRFELIDGVSEKFWAIEHDGKSHTVTFGRIGTDGQSKTKKFRSEDAALASYEKLINEKTSKGYEEIFPPTAAQIRKAKKQREPFLKAILQNPDDEEPYAIFGDWLSERGDPRGEFIHVQLALEQEGLSSSERTKLRKREKQLLSRHEAEWLGDYAPLLSKDPNAQKAGTSRRRRPNCTYSFERGFLARLRVTRLLVPISRMIRDASETRFLKHLVIESVLDEYADDEDSEYEPGPDVPTFDNDRIQFVSAHPLRETKEFTCLESFQIGTIGEEEIGTVKSKPDYRPGDSHCYCNPAAEIVSKMPRLQELNLLCKQFDIDAIFSSKRLKHLRTLRIYHMGSCGADRRERAKYEFPLDKLAKNKTFANLEELAFHPHCEEYHRSYPEHQSFLPLKQVTSLLKSKHLTKLTRLQLRLSDLGDEGCREIVKSGILKRLKYLDLRHGCVTDEGALTLAECSDTKKLEFLDLTRNGLTKHGIQSLRKAKVKFQAANQDTAEQIAEGVYLQEGDFE